VNKTDCLLCGVALEPLDDGRQQHPEVDDCLVRLTDSWGVAIIEEPLARGSDKVIQQPMSLDITFFPFVDDVLEEIFDNAGLPRLGGMSSGRGWSSFSTYQRCPYSWKLKYLDKMRPALLVESPSLAIGSLIHTFLAVHYIRMMDESYPFTPEQIYKAARLKANPQFVEEGWRVFVGYRLFYLHEDVQPLAIEHDLRDPRTGESCRYDMVAFYPESIAGRPAGTYIVEHKSASRFDGDTLEGWVNDGEVIGEVALWQKLGLDHRFGKLQGVVVNLLGKQKEPQYHRCWVAPQSWQVDGHLDDLRRYEGLIQLSRSSNNFPRARQGCIGRYGRCNYFDHCAGAE
jgi:hypothetical protein